MSQDARADEELSTQHRARVLGYDYIDTSAITNKVLYKEILPVDQLKSLRIIPIHADQSNILFGITTTTSQQTMHNLRQQFQDQRISFAIISDNGFKDYITLYDPPPQIVYQEIKINQSNDSELVKQVSGILNSVKADDMLAYLVQQAHRLNASDVHIETRKDYVEIRYRIDGVLHPIATVNYDKYRVLIAAIASAGNISTASDEAQQGHIAQQVEMADGSTVDVNVRIETVQTINSMDVVMRLFNMDKSMYTLDRLGLSGSQRQKVDEIIAKPSGLVMIVGPTGSGKTTTLYSMLNSLTNDSRKIITIEDPVEYQFEEITQIPVTTKEGEDEPKFADKLRAILRLDPDIIMVGEIRDMDTAKTALQAALTGHLVLSTFHASTASAAITRLSDVIGHNPLFVSAIRLIMAQRLVRRLDDDIKVPYSPTEAEYNKLSEIINGLPSTVEKPDLNNLQLFKAGSSETNPYGFKGQIAIREQFQISDKIRQLLEKPDLIISADEIEKAAIDSGMCTMLQDAALKVIHGETTLGELYRVIG